MTSPANTTPVLATSLTPWKRVPISDNGEGLVILTGLTSKPWHNYIGRDGSLDEVWLRVGVAKKLWEAQSYLPKGTRLLVLDGWRPRALHKKIMEEDLKAIKSTPDLQIILDPPDLTKDHPAASLTGGRVGVTLSDEKGMLDMGSIIRRPCPEALMYFYSNSSVLDHQLFHQRRMLLCSAMTRAGFSSGMGSWWRYQFGTQEHHALVGGEAQYGLVKGLPSGHKYRKD